jgi:hypothetical protein
MYGGGLFTIERKIFKNQFTKADNKFELRLNEGRNDNNAKRGISKEQKILERYINAIAEHRMLIDEQRVYGINFIKTLLPYF